MVLKEHDELTKPPTRVRARWNGCRDGTPRRRTSLWRRLRSVRASGAYLRNRPGLAGARVLLGTGILELEWLPLFLDSRTVRLPAIWRRDLESRTLGARYPRMVLAAGPLGAPILIA